MEIFDTAGLLQDRKQMDRFIHALHEYKITNCNSAAERSAYLGYFSAGILLICYHHLTENYCSILIAPNPAAKVIVAAKAGSPIVAPMPTTETGKWVTVWIDGRWAKRGPWETKIEKFLDTLIAELKAAVDGQQAEEEIAKVESDKQAELADSELAEAWK